MSVDLQEHVLAFEYDGLEPELGPELQQVRNIELSMESLREMGGLEDLYREKGSIAINGFEPLILQYVWRLLDDLDLPEDTKKNFATVLNIRDWSEFPEGSNERFVLRELIAKTHRLRHEMLIDWLDNAVDSGFNEVAKFELTELGLAGAAMDRMYIKLRLMDFPIDSNERVKRGLTNECAVVQELPDGSVVEVPYHEVFPEETDAMVAAYTSIIKFLESVVTLIDHPDADLVSSKLAYYVALREATRNSDPEMWKDVDALHPQQVRDSHDLIVVPPSEVAYLGDKVLRAPEISIRFPDLENSRLNERVSETHQRMRSSLASHYPDHGGIQSTLGLLDRSRVVMRSSLGFGRRLDSKPAGQILPNEIPARQAGGIDASLLRESVIKRYPVKVAATKAVFGEEHFTEVFAPTADFDKLITRYIAGHEYGHSVAIVDGTQDRLGYKTLLNPYAEEWKATVAGMMGDVWIPYLNNDATDADLQFYVATYVQNACRYAKARNDDFVAAYFRKSVMIMRVMEKHGLLVKDEANTEFPWKLDMGDGLKLRLFYREVASQFDELIDIYEDGEYEDLEGWLSENLQPSEFTRFVCEKIPVKLEEGQEQADFSVEALCKLPSVDQEPTPGEIQGEVEGEIDKTIN